LGTKDKAPVVIIGVGNILCADEGVGVRVVNELKRAPVLPYVEVFDCGTSGIAVLEALDGAEKAVIVDAVSTGAEPGTIHRLTLEGILAMDDNLFKLVSLHQFDLIATLKVAQLTTAYRMPREVVMIGIEGKSYDFSLELSDEVNRVLPKVIEATLREVESPPLCASK